MRPRAVRARADSTLRGDFLHLGQQSEGSSRLLWREMVADNAKRVPPFARPVLLRTRWLWVDAVCINQDDVEEMNTQVQMMGEIYRAAERVVVWLDGRNLTHTDITQAFFLLGDYQFHDDRSARRLHRCNQAPSAKRATGGLSTSFCRTRTGAARGSFRRWLSLRRCTLSVRANTTHGII